MGCGSWFGLVLRGLRDEGGGRREGRGERSGNVVLGSDDGVDKINEIWDFFTAGGWVGGWFGSFWCGIGC